MGYTKKKRAVAKAADCKPSELERERWEHYGLASYALGGQSYAIGTDEEADEAAAEYIKNTLWAFNPSFLATQTDLPEEVFTAMQDKCEDANETFLTLVERSDDGLEGLVDEAISADGRGHFLSGYDGEEREVTIDGTTFYVYRTN
jgi:hypothetical protein